MRDITWDDEQILIGGDILLGINGVEVREENQDPIRRSMARLAPGENLTMRILRGGKIVELSART